MEKIIKKIMSSLPTVQVIVSRAGHIISSYVFNVEHVEEYDDCMLIQDLADTSLYIYYNEVINCSDELIEIQSGDLSIDVSVL